MPTRSCSRLSKAASCFGKEQASAATAIAHATGLGPARSPSDHVSGRKVLASPFNFAPLQPQSSSIPQIHSSLLAEVLLAAFFALVLPQTCCSCARFEQFLDERRVRPGPFCRYSAPRLCREAGLKPDLPRSNGEAQSQNSSRLQGNYCFHVRATQCPILYCVASCVWLEMVDSGWRGTVPSRPRARLGSWKYCEQAWAKNAQADCKQKVLRLLILPSASFAGTCPVATRYRNKLRPRVRQQPLSAASEAR